MSNMEIWTKLKQPPPEALKEIMGGRLRGMTDVNPQWRYQAMTEQFGPCGVGWKYTVDKVWREDGTDGQVFAFAQVSLFIKGLNGLEWSEPIPGVGGSMLVTQERNGLHSSDEGYKMAITDALSVAMKMIGVAADIYAGRWDGSRYNEQDDNNGFITPEQVKTIKDLVEQTDSDNPNFYKAAKADTIDTILSSEYNRIYQLLMDKKYRMEFGPGADG